MILPRPARAVIFDMDGLLLDTERIYGAALMQAAAVLGFDMPESFCQSMIGIPGPQCEIMIGDFFGPGFSMAEYRRHSEQRLSALTADGIPVKPGADELVAVLTSRRVPMAVATSSSRRTAEKYLARCGLLERFEFVVTRNDVAHAKPSPDLYLRAADLLGIEPAHCVALEDSPTGIRAAHAAGTMPVMVPDILTPGAEIRPLCVAIVANLHEARRLLALD